MRILFDQGTPVAIRDALQSHTVRTAREEGWSTLSNGELLRAAEEAGFEPLLTTDTNLPHPQNLKGRKLAGASLSRKRSVLIKPKMRESVAGLPHAPPRAYSTVQR